mgnify:FL=1
MKSYYEDESVTLYHGDALEVMDALDPLDAHLMTDPPYFNVKADDWDRQWKTGDAFLGWLGDVFESTKRHLSASASAWVFASPDMATRVELLMREHFRVLNSIRWRKEAGWHQKADLSSLRSFLSPWEAVIFAEQYDDAYGEETLSLHRRTFAPLGRYLQQEWERAGWKAGAVGKALGYDSALPVRWAEGSSLPTAEAYQRLRDLLNGTTGGDYLRREYDYLRREYDYLRREYEDLRRPFAVSDRRLSFDIWDFAPVAPYQGKHPCEKPLSLLGHIVETSTRPGDTILDPFTGSGSSLDAARLAGRKAVGVEKDERYCEIAAKRLAQDVLDFGSAS